jgi:hypothetical protein
MTVFYTSPPVARPRSVDKTVGHSRVYFTTKGQTERKRNEEPKTR